MVTLQADWSDQGEGEVSDTLEALFGSKQIPLVAVFSPDDPYRPQVISGMYSKRQLVASIKRAGPSKTNLAEVSKTSSDKIAK